MPKFRLNKIVRDKLLEMYVGLHQKPDYELLDRKQHIEALIAKAAEELRELAEAATDKRAGEIADVLEVLDSLKRVLGLSDTEINNIQAAKRAKSGSFDRGVFIRTLDLEDSDQEWIAYYRREPERHPEITI